MYVRILYAIINIYSCKFEILKTNSYTVQRVKAIEKEFPIVGMIGGAANPVYYHKVMSYVQLKYRKRYLLKKKNTRC